MRIAICALLMFVAGQTSSPALARPARACAAVADLLSPASFRRYPVVTVQHGPWHSPDVRSGQAHLYRTVLRGEGVGPPDFAGHYKVVPHGCGTGATCPMFVDLKTGKVIFLSSLRSVEWDYGIADDLVEVAGIEDSRLVYRPDSRLLVAVGIQNEDERLSGATLCDWRDGNPRLIRFIPSKMFCPKRGAQ